MENLEVFEKEKPGFVIYETTYKKGYMIGKFHFVYKPNLESAVHRIKEYLQTRHLKHLHTVPFLIDIDEKLGEDEDFIDINKT